MPSVKFALNEHFLIDSTHPFLPPQILQVQASLIAHCLNLCRKTGHSLNKNFRKSKAESFVQINIAATNLLVCHFITWEILYMTIKKVTFLLFLPLPTWVPRWISYSLWQLNTWINYYLLINIGHGALVHILDCILQRAAGGTSFASAGTKDRRCCFAVHGPVSAWTHWHSESADFKKSCHSCRNCASHQPPRKEK